MATENGVLPVGRNFCGSLIGCQDRLDDKVAISEKRGRVWAETMVGKKRREWRTHYQKLKRWRVIGNGGGDSCWSYGGAVWGGNGGLLWQLLELW